MKYLSLIFTSTLIAFLGSVAHANERVIAISPYMSPEAAKTQATDILMYLTESEPGDTALILDGYNLSMIGEWTTPTKANYRSPKARIAANRDVVASLLLFAENSAAPSSNGEPTLSGALRLPQLLRYVGENFEFAEPTDLLVLGSPLYEDLDTPALSMIEERFPSDGHLYASIGATPYGAAGHVDLLNGLNIHIGHGANGLSGTERHDYFVERFWTLFVEAQGGKMVSFTNDLPTVFRKIKSRSRAPAHDFVPEPSDKLEMIQLVPVEVEQSIFDRAVETTPLSQAQSRRAEQVEIGLTWDCLSCDLDLYAMAHPGAVPLYYANTSTPQGHYWKDYQNSPEATNGRETIGFTVPLDLRSLALAVNFYSGDAPEGVKAEIRLMVDGNTYAKSFRIDAHSGNSGTGVIHHFDNDRTGDVHTVFIDPLDIVGLR